MDEKLKKLMQEISEFQRGLDLKRYSELYHELTELYYGINELGLIQLSKEDSLHYENEFRVDFENLKKKYLE